MVVQQGRCDDACSGRRRQRNERSDVRGSGNAEENKVGRQRDLETKVVISLKGGEKRTAAKLVLIT